VCDLQWKLPNRRSTSCAPFPLREAVAASEKWVDVGEYYDEKLSAERLRRCYEIAPPRVRQYMDAELARVLERIRPGDMVLDLGCGYGRVLPELARKARLVVGIDNAPASLWLGREMLRDVSNSRLLCMDAVRLGFHDDAFDVVVCIQNGISAFHVDQRALIEESLRVTKPGGIALFSSYSERFWPHRLEWFEMQSREGLLGEIDYERTRDGVIVCKDGFTATTVGPEQFADLTAGLDVETRIVEMDESSVFCEITPRSKGT
jgi:SAM-dependent methyltransferase